MACQIVTFLLQLSGGHRHPFIVVFVARPSFYVHSSRGAVQTSALVSKLADLLSRQAG